MCGIASLFSPNRTVNPDILKRMTDALVHRGPDGEGQWVSEDRHAGLGHRRLSIVGLSTGTQPLHSSDHAIHAIVNGELYGYRDIKKNLEERGYTFKTESDSEVALYLYAAYGLSFVEYLRGEFSIVIYDEQQKRLIAVRDRFGIKPLCYHKATDGTLVIASEAKAIFASGIVDPKWDKKALIRSCHIQYPHEDRTLFSDIKQLKAGHMLVADDTGCSIRRYWDMDYPTVSDKKSDREWIEEFHTLFNESVQLRLQADVPYCFHLSGGIDSSAVAATAQRITGKPVDCFTVTFANDAYSEEPIARRMAEHLGANHHLVPLHSSDMSAYLEDAVFYSEGLAVNGHLVGKYMLNRAIHQAGFKVALTGEGADEVLAGYPHFREDIAASDTDKASLYASNQQLAGLFLSDGETLPTEEFEKNLGYLPAFLKAKASLGFRLSALLRDGYKQDNPFQGMIHEFDVAGQLRGRDTVHQSAYLWSKTALQGYILRTLGDGCEMAHSVEGRLPYLDHILFDLLRRMPIDMKIRGMTEKFVLREAARKDITEELYTREKKPFIAPPTGQFGGKEFENYLQDNLRSKDFAAMGFFDPAKVTALLDRMPSASAQQKVAYDPVLMLMLTSLALQRRYGLSA